MDWLKKLLEGKGLSEEQMKEIVEGAESNLKGYVPKHRFDEINAAKKQLEADLKDRDKQLNDLKQSAGDNEGLKKQIEELQTTNKTATEQYEAKIKEMQVNAAIKLALQGKAHDADIVASMLDKSKIVIGEDGQVLAGLEDQLKALQESKAFLFVTKQDGDTKFKGVNPPDGSTGQEKNNPRPTSLAEAVKMAFSKQQIHNENQ